MKHILISTLFVVFLATAQAQEINPRHEFSINAGAGVSSLQYKPNNATQIIGYGGKAGLGYTLFFCKNWGLSTGADINLYKSEATFKKNITGSNSVTTEANPLLPGTSFDFSYTINDYTEKQQALYINIPLMLQYQVGDENKFYAALGGKIGLPVSATYKAENADITTSGYFPSTSTSIYDLPEYGLGEYSNLSQKGDLDLDLAYFASAEIGAKWAIGKKNSLYTGFYVDYGLNNVLKENNKPFVSYAQSSELPMNSMVESQINNEAIADKISPLAVGINLRLAFGCGEIKNKNKSSSAPTSDTNKNKKTTTAKADPTSDEAIRAALAAEKAKREEAQRKKMEEAQRLAKEQEEAVQRWAQENSKKEESQQVVQTTPVEQPVQPVQPKTTKTSTTKPAKQTATKQPAKQTVAQPLKTVATPGTPKEILQTPVELYAISQTSLTPSQKRALDEKVTVLQQNPDMNVFIYGHTCDIGGDAINQKIGLQRAEKAKAYLVSQGIDPNRIFGTISKLDREPIVPNTNEANRKQNRRVELIVAE